MTETFNIEDEIHDIAVSLRKSRNMHITAGIKYAKLWERISSPGNDGAQQMADAGYPITKSGLWLMLTHDDDFPREIIGPSQRNGDRLLAIGRHGTPEEADRRMREERKAENAKGYADRKEAVTKSALKGEKRNNVPDAQFSSLEALKGAVKDLSSDDFTAFKKWFREFCGA